MGKDQDLLEASRSGNVMIVEKILSNRKRSGPLGLGSLLRKGANCQDANGYTPLHHAALNGHKGVVAILLQHDCLVNIADNQGSSPLHLAAWNGYLDIVQILLTSGQGYINVNQQNCDGETPLHCASQYGHTNVVAELLENDVDPTLPNCRDETCIDLAALYGRLETVHLLVRKHPELLRIVTIKHSPLHLASKNGHLNVAECLLHAGYNINTKTETGSALHEAALYGKVEIVKLLLENDIDVSITDKNGKTAAQLLEEQTSSLSQEILDLIKGEQLCCELQSSSRLPIRSGSSSSSASQISVASQDVLIGRDRIYQTPPSHEAVESLKTSKNKYGSSYLPMHCAKFTTQKPSKPPRKNAGPSSPQSSPTSEPRLHSYECALSHNAGSGDIQNASVINKIKNQSVASGNLQTQADFSELEDFKSKLKREKELTDAAKPVSNESTVVFRRSKHPQHSSDSSLTTAVSFSKQPFCSIDGSSSMDNGVSTESDMGNSTSNVQVKSKLALQLDLSKNEKDASEDSARPGTPDHPPPSPNTAQLMLLEQIHQHSGSKRASRDIETLTDESLFSNPNAENNGQPDEPLDCASCIIAETDHLLNVQDRTPKEKPKCCLLQKLDKTVSSDSLDRVSVSSADASLMSENGPFADSERSSDDHGLSHGSTTQLPQHHKISPVYQNVPRPRPRTSKQPGSITEPVPRQRNVNYESMDPGQNYEDMQISGKEVHEVCKSTPRPVEAVPKQQSVEVPSESLQEHYDVSSSHIHHQDAKLDCKLVSMGQPVEQYIEMKPVALEQPSEVKLVKLFSDNFPQFSCGDKTRTGNRSDILNTSEGSFAGSNSYCETSNLTFPRRVKRQAYENFPLGIATIKPSRTNTESISKTELAASRPSFKANSDKYHVHNAVDFANFANVDTKQTNLLAGASQQIIGINVQKQCVKNKCDMSTKLVADSSTSTTEPCDENSNKKITPSEPVVVEKHEDSLLTVTDKDRDRMPTTGGGETSVHGVTVTLREKKPSPPTLRSDVRLSPLDENAEWAKIADIMASFGGGITRESVFAREIEPEFKKKISGSHGTATLTEWLEHVGLQQYENTLVANGYDHISYIGSDVLDDQDLLEIGITDHPHRQQLLLLAKELPTIVPLDQEVHPVESIEQWLHSLHLHEYLPAFHANGFFTMERIRKIWEVELVTVLGINMLGHRKRILASLGDRRGSTSTSPNLDISEIKPAEVNTITWDLSPHEEDLPRISLPSRFDDLSFFKDYSKVNLSSLGPVPSEYKDLTVSSISCALSAGSDKLPDFSDAVKPFQQKKLDEQLNIRPPDQTFEGGRSPVRQWRHKPEVLIKGCCNYNASYLGSSIVKNVKGYESTKEAIVKMKQATKQIHKFPIITLSISYRGVKFIDSKSKMVIAEHEIKNINCACQDGDDLNYFAYITKDLHTVVEQNYCHVFSVDSTDLATEVLLTLGQAFEVAYQLALQSKTSGLSLRKSDEQRKKGKPSPKSSSKHHHRSSPATSLSQKEGSSSEKTSSKKLNHGSTGGSSKSSSLEEIIC